jgi:hypothetical protein
VEELLACALIDQLAGIDRAGGDHAVEGCVDLLKGLQIAQAIDIGLRGVDGGGRGRGLADEGVGVLLRDGVGLDQAGVALGLDARDVGVGIGGCQVGLSLGELLIELRRSSAPFFTREPMS